MQEAKPIILEYEWLRTMGRAQVCYGLFSPDRELLGVECFGSPYTQRNFAVGVVKQVCLVRGASIPYAGQHAASFSIAWACKLGAKSYGWDLVVAYSDPDAGEIGTVYQACGWLYLGQGTGHGLQRTEWRDTRQIPLDGVEASWVSSRMLAHRGYRGPGCWDRARRDGWESRVRPAKHIYCWRSRPDVVLRYGALPYPRREARPTARTDGAEVRRA